MLFKLNQGGPGTQKYLYEVNFCKRYLKKWVLLGTSGYLSGNSFPRKRFL